MAYASLSGYPVFDADGVFRGYRGSGTDVSTRMLMENARRESEERYRTIVETAHDAVLVIDARDYRITDANGAASRLYGIGDDLMLGTRQPELTAKPGSSPALSGSGPAHRAPHPSTRTSTFAVTAARFPVEVSARGVSLAGQTQHRVHGARCIRA